MKNKEITFDMFRASRVRMTKSAYEVSTGQTDIDGQVLNVYYGGYHIVDNLNGTHTVIYNNTKFQGNLEECEEDFWSSFVCAELNGSIISLSDRIAEVTDNAENVFWDFVAKSFPECKTGDVGPDTIIPLRENMRRAISIWYDNNKPD
jgi:hypothetical protein